MALINEMVFWIPVASNPPFTRPFKWNTYANLSGFSIIDYYNRTIVYCGNTELDPEAMQLALAICEAKYPAVYAEENKEIKE